MTVVILRERNKSRPAMLSASDPSSSWAKLKFVALGTDDDQIVLDACIDQLPPTYAGMFLQSCEIDCQGVDGVRGTGVWDVVATYSPLQPKKPGDPQFSFDTTAESRHVTLSKQTLSSGVVGSDWEQAPSFGGAIGVNGESIEGVDVLVPTFGFSQTVYIPIHLMTPFYKWLLFKLTATVNSDFFQGLAPGENLFLGAQGSIRGNEEWEVKFSFKGESNAYDIPIPGTDQGPADPPGGDPLGLMAEADDIEEAIDLMENDPEEGEELGLVEVQGIDFTEPENPPPIVVVPPRQKGQPQPPVQAWTGNTVPFKAGHDYLWYRFAESVVPAGDKKFLVRKPQFWYVEQLYYRANHGLLGIG